MKPRLKILLMALLFFSLVGSAVQAKDQGEMVAGLYLFNKINMARKFPLEAVTNAGVGASVITSAVGINPSFFTEKRFPLAWNNSLYASALDHGADMMNNVYYSYTSPDGKTIQDRILDKGYAFEKADERLGILIFDAYIEPLAAVQIIFDNMIKDELLALLKGLPTVMLNPEYTEIGVVFTAGVIDVGQKDFINAYLVVLDIAKPLFPKSYIIGNIYNDVDQNGLFTPEEAVQGMTMVLKNLTLNTTETMPTAPLGFFQFESTPGFLVLQAEDAFGTLKSWKNFVGGGTENQYINLKMGSWLYLLMGDG